MPISLTAGHLGHFAFKKILTDPIASPSRKNVIHQPLKISKAFRSSDGLGPQGFHLLHSFLLFEEGLIPIAIPKFPEFPFVPA
jgi:hypothetical protein